jgi:SAM-dependent methyltransferase
MAESTTTIDWYERSYKAAGIDAQRRYPNEELIRFLARNYFKLTRDERARISILDAGCGSCSNLWAIAREGFDAHGVDISPEAVRLGRRILAEWGVQAELGVGDLLRLPYENEYFDAVVDVFSSYVLNATQSKDYLREVVRVLKAGGRFFLFTPSVGSDAFRNHAPATKIDEFTLNGIHRKNSPYYGNFYPFRFSEVASLQKLVHELGLETESVELTSRTHNQMAESFQFISLEARRRS